jgi:p-methyltransferase
VRRKVAIVGHVTAEPTVINLSENSQQIASYLKLFNYTRVLTPENLLVDHVAYLKNTLHLQQSDNFSVWEMSLCAGLLLKSHLKRNGIETLLINYIDSDNLTREMGMIRDFDPDIVVLSTTFVLSSKHLVEAGRMIRRWLPKAFIVAGGHHVFTSLLYMDDKQKCDYLLSSRADAFVNDVQGEQTLLEVVKAWPEKLDRVPNLIWKNSQEEVFINKRLEENNDINHTLINFDDVRPGSVIHIRTARSCAFKCAFCSYPTIAGDLALMELENVIATLREAKEAGVRAVFFVDDTFNVPRPRFEKLVNRMIAEGLDMPWYSFLRCQFVDEKLVLLMKKSGCQGVFLGVESGSDQVLKNMDKGGASKYYQRGITWLKEQGIITVGAFVIGFPGETAITVEETAEFIERSGLDFYFLQPFYYLYHTPVHRVADKYRLIGKGLEWSHATMNSSQACHWLDQLFVKICGPAFVNPDYNLWEVAYLLSKGLDMQRILHYRHMMNQMTVAQMLRYHRPSPGVTTQVS